MIKTHFHIHNDTTVLSDRLQIIRRFRFLCPASSATSATASHHTQLFSEIMLRCAGPQRLSSPFVMNKSASVLMTFNGETQLSFPL